jgi:hypothetical protein
MKLRMHLFLPILALPAAQLVSASTVTLALANQSEISVTNPATTTVTGEFNASPGTVDGLVYTASNLIAYTVNGNGGGQVDLFNTTTHANTILDTITPPGLGFIKDITLDPLGKSVVVSAATSSGVNLERINLATHNVTGIGPAASNDIRGLTYDSAGHLFAVMNQGVAQLDPQTGQVLKSITVPNSAGSSGAQGIVFDPFTGNLFVTNDSNDLSGGSGLWEVPTSLATVNRVDTLQGGISDGLASDGKGDLFIAGGNFLDEFKIATNTLTSLDTVPGITDVAIQPSQSVVSISPEPGIPSLLGLGGLGLWIGLFRRKR